MKTAIVYASVHHGNTKKVIEAMTAGYEVDLINAAVDTDRDLSGYDMIGFASGIYYGKFHASLIRYAKEKLPFGKAVFFVCTKGAPSAMGNFTKSIEEAVEGKNSNIKGSYSCRGYDTFGPFKFIGGLAKGHPDAKELKAAAEFYSKLEEE